MLQDLDLSAVANEDVLAKIAKSYTDYLHQCKSQGMQFIQPGRFVLPSDLEGGARITIFSINSSFGRTVENLEKNSQIE